MRRRRSAGRNCRGRDLADGSRKGVGLDGVGMRVVCKERSFVSRIAMAAPEPVDRDLAVANDADEERRDLHRQVEDLPGEADGFVEQRRLRMREARPRRRRAGKEGERLATANGGRRPRSFEQTPTP